MRLRLLALIVAAGLGTLWALPTSAGQPARRLYRIGVLHTGFFQIIPVVEGLKAGLKAAGLEETRDVTFDIRFTRGNLQAVGPAALALANAGIDLLVVEGEEAARAAQAATQTIPVVFTLVGDPVAAGIVKEIAYPGGNLTGVSSLATELAPKRLETLKVLYPTMRRVWAIYYAGEASSQAAARKVQEVGPRLNVEVVARPVGTTDELVATLKELRPGDGLLCPPTLTLNIPGLILDLVLGAGWPAIFPAAFWVQSGAVVSYGSDVYSDGQQAARIVTKILQGARPQDLPVEGSNKIEMAINLRTARSLKVSVPTDLLIRADRVIE